ncbi:MAG: ECF transporter S component [Clostridia bacterium]|nr:ECF transporter S component [Clostridia bacterium]
MMYVKNPRLRLWLSILIPSFLIPAVVLAGALLFDARAHLFISLAVAILSLLLFVAGFEQKKIGTRRTVLVSVMIALCIVGRIIPFFKPVTALVVLCAIYLGPQAGFYTGALSALLSNFIFGQGPWTPFQMLAWGLIGLFAGLFAKPLQKRRVWLLLYGLFAGVAYSAVMDVWSVLWATGSMDAQAYLAAMLTALPHTALYVLSNLLFLWICAKPIGDKLQRIKIKYEI